MEDAGVAVENETNGETFSSSGTLVTNTGTSTGGRLQCAVQLYYSSATPSLQAKKDAQYIRWTLEKKRIYFEEYDIHWDQMRMKEMRSRSGDTHIPQLFIENEYYGGAEDVEEMEESGELDEILDLLFPQQPAPEKAKKEKHADEDPRSDPLSAKDHSNGGSDVDDDLASDGENADTKHDDVVVEDDDALSD